MPIVEAYEQVVFHTDTDRSFPLPCPEGESARERASERAREMHMGQNIVSAIEWERGSGVRQELCGDRHTDAEGGKIRLLVVQQVS